MGNIFEDICIKRKEFSFYEFIVGLYIVALFVFENAQYSTLFSIIQACFLGFSIFEALKRKKILKSKVYIWALIFCVVALGVTLIEYDSANSTFQIILKNVVRCVMLSIYISSESHSVRLIHFFGIGGVICSFLLLKSYIDSGLVIVDFKYASLDRIGANIAGGNVNIVAMNMAFSFTAWLVIFKNAKNKVKKVFSILCLIAVVGSSMFTGTRKILLYYVVVILAYNVLYNARKIKNIMFFALIVLLFYFCLMKVEPLYYLLGHKVDFFSGDTLYTLYNYSDSIREELFLGGMHLFSDNIFVGVGFGNTTKYLGVYTHNNYIELLACGGLIGFCTYYSIYVFIARKSIRKWRNNEIHLYILLSLIGLLVLEIFQVTYLYGIPWIFLAFAASYCSNDYYFKIKEQ